jgi:hypothetical protein
LEGETLDRTIRGLIAGLIAAFPMNIWNLTDYYFFQITKIRFMDWAAILMTGKLPHTTLEFYVSFFSQLVWDGWLGIIFAYWIGKVSGKFIYIKGIVYGYLLTFIFTSIAHFYRLPVIGQTTIQTPQGRLSNQIAVLLWSIMLAYVLKLDQIQSN